MRPGQEADVDLSSRCTQLGREHPAPEDRCHGHVVPRNLRRDRLLKPRFVGEGEAGREDIHQEAAHRGAHVLEALSDVLHQETDVLDLHPLRNQLPVPLQETLHRGNQEDLEARLLETGTSEALSETLTCKPIVSSEDSQPGDQEDTAKGRSIFCLIRENTVFPRNSQRGNQETSAARLHDT